MVLTVHFAGFFLVLSGCLFELILADLEEYDLSAIKIIEKYGYPAESHLIETEDGYFLQLHRIPHGKNSTNTSSRQPLLFAHGLVTSSNSYLMLESNSLPFLLAERGYDVWLGNFRGNQYANLHRNFSSDSSEFWNFSFQEFGFYDLPAQIDYICNYTQRNNVTLLGHSCGTTSQFVMATTRPEYQKKVRAAVLIAAPSVFHRQKERARLLAPIYPLVYSKSFTNREVPGDGVLTRAFVVSLGLFGEQDIWKYLLSQRISIQKYIKVSHFLLRFYPSSSSMKTLAHYFQIIESGKFRQYDYGPEENLIRYQSREPPEYNLESITIPMGLFFTSNDVFADIEDEEYLLRRMKNIKMVLDIKKKEFRHLNFLFGVTTKEMVYDKLLEFVDNLEKL